VTPLMAVPKRRIVWREVDTLSGAEKRPSRWPPFADTTTEPPLARAT
jgi:hypothetical protein